jgi:DNA-binding beta-propeller fold protein YncE
VTGRKWLWRLAAGLALCVSPRLASAVDPALTLALDRVVPLSGHDFGLPSAIAAGPLGRLYLADPGRGTVFRVDSTAAVLYAFDSPANQPGMQPLDIEVTGFKVYVLDAQSNAIFRFSDRGSFLDVLRTFDAPRGELPRAISADNSNRVLVCMPFQHQVRVFDERNRDEITVGGLGSEPGEFLRPLGVAFAPDGSFFVADTGNRRMQRFGGVGNFEAAFADSLAEPRGCAVGQAGELYVADPGRRVLHLFGPTGIHRDELLLPDFRPIDVTVVGDTAWALSADPPAILRVRVQRGR